MPPLLQRDLQPTQHYHRPGGDWPEFAKQLKRLIRGSICLNKRHGELSAERFAVRWQRLHDLLAQGWNKPHARRLVKRLRRHQDELFTFLDHPDVPSGNNHAE
jgi:transposase